MMRIADMHCDTLIEGWRHPERSFYDGDASINLKLLKENGSLVQFFAIYLSRNEMKTMDPYDILKGIYGYYKEQMEKFLKSQIEMIQKMTGTEKVSFYKDENGEPIFFDGGIFELKF